MARVSIIFPAGPNGDEIPRLTPFRMIQSAERDYGVTRMSESVVPTQDLNDVKLLVELEANTAGGLRRFVEELWGHLLDEEQRHELDRQLERG